MEIETLLKTELKMSWKASERLMDSVRHYAAFPATGVSLKNMVQFGSRPSTGGSLILKQDSYLQHLGTLFRASQFLSEELPIRLAHRVQELETLPDHLSEMPSIERVRDWYSQSFEVRRSPSDYEGLTYVIKGAYPITETYPRLRHP